MIALVAVNLGIDRRHEMGPPKPLSFSKGMSHFRAKLAEPARHWQARLRRLAKASALTSSQKTSVIPTGAERSEA